jgi:hypothetical protein
MKPMKMNVECLHIGLRSAVVGAPKHKTFLNTNNGEVKTSN